MIILTADAFSSPTAHRSFSGFFPFRSCHDVQGAAAAEARRKHSLSIIASSIFALAISALTF